MGDTRRWATSIRPRRSYTSFYGYRWARAVAPIPSKYAAFEPTGPRTAQHTGIASVPDSSRSIVAQHTVVASAPDSSRSIASQHTVVASAPDSSRPIASQHTLTVSGSDEFHRVPRVWAGSVPFGKFLCVVWHETSMAALMTRIWKGQHTPALIDPSGGNEPPPNSLTGSEVVEMADMAPAHRRPHRVWQMSRPRWSMLLISSTR